jgi:hypothetical protein
MADTAYQTKYRQEFIAGFEKRQSLARRTVVTETEINGNTATFLVADSGSATAVTRGVNGDIPTRPDNLNQYSATLKEWHDVPERTNFNIYASQGDGRRIMQMTSMAVVNRKIDSDIHTALSAATQTLTMTQTDAGTFLADVLDFIVTLGENSALEDGEEPFALITPGFHANLHTLNQFTSVDYINNKAFENTAKSKAFNWMGINFIVDQGLAGVGTSSATCYAYVRNAIGHACDMENIQTKVGYDEKNDKSWARCTAYMGSKLLQNSGIVKITHDDTAIIGA